MKKTKLWWSMELLQWLFFAIIPLIIFIIKCTTIGGQPGGTKFIVGCSSYILLLIIYMIIKKTLLKGYIEKLRNKQANLEAQIDTETDQTKIPLIEKALGKAMLYSKAFNTIPVLLVIGIILLVVKALEHDVITMYAVLGVSLVSCLFGFICQIVQALNIRSKHRREEE